MFLLFYNITYHHCTALLLLLSVEGGKWNVKRGIGNENIVFTMSKEFDTHLKPNFRNFDRNGRCRKISKPHIIGYFSVDQNRQFSPDHSNCKYLRLPARDQPINFNLNEGYELVQHKPASANDEKLDHILKYILLNIRRMVASQEKRIESSDLKEKFLHFDIICFRGKLRMLMCTPYEFREGWSLLVTKWKGNIYICGFETGEERNKRQSQTEESKRICSYGFKFEQYIMSDSPTSEPVTTSPVVESEEFCCMYTTKLEGTSILYGAEMDGIESTTDVDLSKTNLNDLRFTEVKVRIKPSHQRQIDNYHRFKTRNWWCQSYLTNVEKIVVGLRTESGIVNELETIDVHSMPRKNKDYWSDTVCMEFLNEILSMVKYHVKNINCPDTVYKYDYEPKNTSSIRCTVFDGATKLSFLPDWYTKQVQQYVSKQSSL